MPGKQHEIISFFAQDLDWQPWDKFMKGAPPNDAIPNAPEWDGNFGGWVKILSTPDSGDGWTFLVRHVPPPGRKIRFSAISRSREQCYCLLGKQVSKSGEPESLEGEYSFLQADTVHGGTLSNEVIHLVHYDGAPDEILRYEVVKA
jgi:hypothetical protein